MKRLSKLSQWCGLHTKMEVVLYGWGKIGMNAGFLQIPPYIVLILFSQLQAILSQFSFFTISGFPEFKIETWIILL